MLRKKRREEREEFGTGRSVKSVLRHGRDVAGAPKSEPEEAGRRVFMKVLSDRNFRGRYELDPLIYSIRIREPAADQYGLYLLSMCFFCFEDDFAALEVAVDVFDGLEARMKPSSPAVNTTPACEYRQLNR